MLNTKDKEKNVVTLNPENKRQYLNNLSASKNSKPFWNHCKPYFSNKHAQGDSKIMLIEKNEILLDNQLIANEFNKYFGNIVYSLDLYDWPSISEENQSYNDVEYIVLKFKEHPSILKVKSEISINKKFSFKDISVEELEKIILTNKVYT